MTTSKRVTVTTLLKPKPRNTSIPMSTTNGSNENNNKQFKLLLLTLMVLQNTGAALVGRHTRSSVPQDQLFEVNHLITITELSKLLISLALEFSTSKDLGGEMRLHLLANKVEFCKIGIPALLYLLQNSLLYVALQNLTAPVFQVTYQAKLLTTALLSVLMLNRRYSVKQWLSLGMLGVGVAIVILSSSKTSNDVDNQIEQSFAKGLICVTVACLSSAAAGVYTELILKSKNHKTATPSLWMRNIQMALFSVIIAIVQNFFSKPSEVSSSNGYFHGFTFWVWVLVALQAGGGLLVAAIIKYADNVLKGLATGVAVAISALVSKVLFHTELSSQFVVGAAIILTSVHIFSNGGVAKSSNTSSTADVQMKPLVLPK